MLPILPNVEIKDTGTAKGLGVFALREFREGELVEACPVILFQCGFSDLPRALQERVFNWTVLSSAAIPNIQAVALGYGGMYNHSNPANMRYEARVDAQTPLLLFVATRSVPAGQELTINYNSQGGVPNWDNNHWFDRLGIDPIES